MAQVHGCLGQYAVCAIRTARLDVNCQPVAGPNNAVAQRCVVTFTASPEREEGTEYVCKDGCGIVCWTIKDCDKEKRMNLDLEMCVRDLEMLELLTTAELVLDAGGDVIGVERQGVDIACPNGASLELWAKVGYGSGACPPDIATAATTPKWWRYTYPRAFMFMGDTTMEDGVYQIQLTGYSETNPGFGNGAFNDYPGATPMGANALESVLLDIAGPPSTQCGYINTPLQIGGAVRVEKTGEVINASGPNGAAAAGDILRLTFTVYNDGNEDLNTIAVNDTLVAVPPAANMAVGAMPQILIVDYVLTAGDITAGFVTNDVDVSATAVPTGPVTDGPYTVIHTLP